MLVTGVFAGADAAAACCDEAGAPSRSKRSCANAAACSLAVEVDASGFAELYQKPPSARIEMKTAPPRIFCIASRVYQNELQYAVRGLFSCSSQVYHRGSLPVSGSYRREYQMSRWSYERISALKKMWAEGVSPNLIAARLGGFTRNAIIGKARRLNLGRHASASKNQSGRPRSKSRDDAQLAAVPPVETEIPTPVTGTTYAPVYVPHTDDDPLYREVRSRRGKRNALLTCDESGCRWPIGNPTDRDFHFCGKKRKPGRPYCEHHEAIAHPPRQHVPNDKSKAFA